MFDNSALLFMGYGLLVLLVLLPLYFKIHSSTVQCGEYFLSIHPSIHPFYLFTRFFIAQAIIICQWMFVYKQINRYIFTFIELKTDRKLNVKSWFINFAVLQVYNFNFEYQWQLAMSLSCSIRNDMRYFCTRRAFSDDAFTDCVILTIYIRTTKLSVFYINY